MPRAIDPQTLAAIGGQKQAQAAGQFQQSMSNLYSISADMKDRQMQRTLNEKNMELMDLKIETQKQKGLGDSAVGVLNMLDNVENPMNFAEQYRAFRSSAPTGIRENLPEGFQSIDQARAWAGQTAARADKLLPYLEIQAKDAGTKKWEAIAQLLVKPPEARSAAEQRFLDYNAKADTNIYVGGPSKEKTRDTIRGLQAYTIPGTETPVLDALDEKSRNAFIAAVDSLTQTRIDVARMGQEPLSRVQARDQAIQLLAPQIQAKETLMQKLPFVGDMIDSDYVFVPNEAAFAAIQGYDPKNPPTGTKGGPPKTAEPLPPPSAGDIETRGGWRFDMRYDPPKNLGKRTNEQTSAQPQATPGNSPAQQDEDWSGAAGYERLIEGRQRREQEAAAELEQEKATQDRIDSVVSRIEQGRKVPAKEAKAVLDSFSWTNLSDERRATIRKYLNRLREDGLTDDPMLADRGK